MKKYWENKDSMTVQKESKRNVKSGIEFYDLDVIFTVAYRVESK
jgi:hypothetical protein